MLNEIVLAFCGMFLLDFVWARYTQAINAKNPGLASFMAVCITGLSALVVVTYVNDIWMLIPTCLGAGVGTWASLKE